MSTPYTGLTHIASGQSQKEVTANEALDGLDKVINGSVAADVATGDATIADLLWGLVQIAGDNGASARSVVVPTVQKIFVVQGGHVGAGAVTVKTAAGTGVVVASGTSKLLFCDGTNVVALI